MGCGVVELTRALFGKIKPSGVLALDGETLRLSNTSKARQRRASPSCRKAGG